MWKVLNLFGVFVAAVQIIHSVTPVIHTYKYFKTASSNIPNLPEYWAVFYVDDVEISHYDSKSRKYVARQDWMNKITAEDPHYWERETQRNMNNEQLDKVRVDMWKERFNHTGGVHMIQRISGCQWDNETDEVDGSSHISFDGEDFLSFELQTLRWIAAKPQAFPTKLKWDQSDFYRQYKQLYHTEICPSLLKKFVRHGEDVLMRKELPVVSLLQKTPSSAISCHASGFYPSRAALFWTKDGQELHEGVEMGETLPNHDGTFQTTTRLKVPPPAREEGRYRCVFQLAGVERHLITELDSASILSNARIQEERVRKLTLAVAVPLALAALLAAPLLLLVKRYASRAADYAAASADADSELATRPASKSDSASE